MSEKIIEVNNLSKRYKKGKELALDAVSFYVEKGAFLHCWGPMVQEKPRPFIF